MSWVGVGVAAVGAVSGAQAANRNRKAARAHDAYRKAAITYSPWTGMGDPGAANVGNTDTFSGMLGGAAKGFAVGSGIGGAFKGMGGASNFATTPGSPLGGEAMAQNLGEQFTGAGSGIGQAQSALAGAGNAQGMWGQMAQKTGMGSAGALGNATNQAFTMPQMGSSLGGGTWGSMKPSYTLGMNAY